MQPHTRKTIEGKTGTVHMMCGYIGAGKSTYARQLERESGGIRFNSDFVMVSLFGNKLPDDHLQIYRRIDNVQRHYARRLVSLGVDVIFDYGFWNRAQRDEVRAFANDCDAPFKMHYINAPDQAMRQRAVERRVEQDDETVVITYAIWDSLRSQFDPPHKDERQDGSFVEINVH